MAHRSFCKKTWFENPLISRGFLFIKFLDFRQQKTKINRMIKLRKVFNKDGSINVRFYK